MLKYKRRRKSFFIMKRTPKSIKKFIRREKAQIRRQFFDAKKQNEMISDIYNNILEQVKQPVKTKDKKIS